MLARDIVAIQDVEYLVSLATDMEAEENMRRSIEAELVALAEQEDDMIEELLAPRPLSLEEMREARLRALDPIKKHKPVRRARSLIGMSGDNILTNKRRQRSA